MMKSSIWGFLVAGALFTAIATSVADDAKDEAIKKDRKQIEGTWRVVDLEVDGVKSMEEDAKKLMVVNGSDGTWSLRSEDNEITKGTSEVDPTKKPKTIEFHSDGQREKEKAISTLESTNSVRKHGSCASLHRERNAPPSFLPCRALSIFSSHLSDWQRSSTPNCIFCTRWKPISASTPNFGMGSPHYRNTSTEIEGWRGKGLSRCA